MPPFLLQTAQYIYENHGNNLSEIAVILPNRRAGLFLRKYLAGMLPKASWSPAVLSIEEFLASISGLKEAEQIHCLLELYRIHCEAEKEKAQSFDEFLHWGGQLLSDFNEIDRCLADPKALFSYLDEVRVMTIWNPDNAPLTEFQQNYLKFYKSLYTYYSGLSTFLLSRGEAYQGLIFRQAWKKIEQEETEMPWEKIIFTGFNALTSSEEKIIDHLVKAGTGELLWDADSYYVDDPKQEAGDSLRQWFKKWPGHSYRWKSDDFRSGKKEIEVIGVPDRIGQVKLAGNLLDEWHQQEQLTERIAVILPDEKLLLPLLNSLPRGIDAVNITMGLPLSQTPLAEILMLVYDMHHHAIKMAPNRNHSGRFYFRDLVKVLQHAYINRLASTSTGGNPFAFRELVEKIKTGQKRFLQRNDLVMEQTGLFSANVDFLNRIVGVWDSLDGALTALQSLVQDIVNAIVSAEPSLQGPGKESTPKLELEYAYAIARILRQLRLLVTDSAGFLTWDSMAKFLKQLLDTTMLPFYGEPLKGLQIMGMLETRTLDFERVIILSCNEGILPSGKSVQSFIPFDVRKNFNLPLSYQKDAVYAYHFYRLLQHSSRVWLLYNTEPGQMGGGDMSRYIRQIETEMTAVCPSLSIHKEVLITPMINKKQQPPIRIGKGSDLLGILRKKALSGFAPTALNTFRSCSLRFYFSEVAGLKEPEEEEDEIDSRILGSAVHHALMNLYKPYVQTLLTQDHLSSMESRIDGVIDTAFREVFKGDTVTSGKNLLLVEVARIMIRKFIRREKSDLENLAQTGETLTVDLLEQPLSRTLFIPLDGSGMEVRFKGFVDRVDRAAGITRVIDYKTGSVAVKEVTFSDWDALISDPSLDKGFQLLMYAWLLAGKNPSNAYQAGIISLKKQSSGFITVTMPDDNGKKKRLLIGREEFTKIEEILIRILSGIFDPGQEFCQTSDDVRCIYCPYRSICGR